MNFTAEFRKHAAQCRQMASIAPDPASRAEWTSMALRWARLAEHGSALDDSPRRRPPQWRKRQHAGVERRA
jgi:hypothetical protein